MGTNYYWHYNICDCCGREDIKHICKSHNKFQGYFTDSEWNDETNQYDSPKPEIVSWQDWKNTLLNTPGQIWNEYNDHVKVDEFIKEVEAVPMESRRRQYDWMKDHGRLEQHHPGHENDWLDKDGFSFSSVEFS